MFEYQISIAYDDQTIKETKDVKLEDVLAVYYASHWSSAPKPEKLFNALLNSYSFVTAWDDESSLD